MKFKILNNARKMNKPRRLIIQERRDVLRKVKVIRIVARRRGWKKFWGTKVTQKIIKIVQVMKFKWNAKKINPLNDDI